MAKTKTPFLSLGAHGSVGESITAQKRPASTMLREKPFPADPYSLPQAYQRWLYEDYAYLWRQQLVATRQQFASAGVRFHLTGFQYWMKYQLKNLPDILGWWKLDEKAGAIAYDSSRLLNHGTIVGASPAPGVIDSQLYFDGLNDMVAVFPVIPFDFSSRQISLECFVYVVAATAAQQAFTSDSPVPRHFAFIRWLDGSTSFEVFVSGVRQLVSIGTITNIGQQYHLLATYDAIIGQGTLYIDGIQDCQLALAIGTIDPWLWPFFGLYVPATWSNIKMDNVIFYNRILDPTEALRHSLRRYPS